MKLVLALLALFVFILPTKAGTITITVTTAVAPCNAGACTKTYTDTDANLAKIVTAYAPQCQAQNLVGSPPVPTACSSLQTLNYWFNGLIAGTAANVTNFLQQQQINALTPIVPINPQ